MMQCSLRLHLLTLCMLDGHRLVVETVRVVWVRRERFLAVNLLTIDD